MLDIIMGNENDDIVGNTAVSVLRSRGLITLPTVLVVGFSQCSLAVNITLSLLIAVLTTGR